MTYLLAATAALALVTLWAIMCPAGGRSPATPGESLRPRLEDPYGHAWRTIGGGPSGEDRRERTVGRGPSGEDRRNRGKVTRIGQVGHCMSGRANGAKGSGVTNRSHRACRT